MLDPEGFTDPWEQLRLLSDTGRNQILLGLLQRRAPGAIVAEIGAGTGLWSLVAAASGARHVYAIEPTPLHRTISALVDANGLADTITVVPATIQEAIAPRGGADLVFSELLNVDPLAEEVLEAMRAGASWLAPGGVLAPGTLSLHAALIADRELATEYDTAWAQIRSITAQVGLNVAPLEDLLSDPGPYTHAAPDVRLLGPSVPVCRLRTGTDERPPAITPLALRADRAGAAGGVAVWFSADYDGQAMANPPGQSGHWGVLTSAWAHPVPLREGEHLRVRVIMEDGSIEVVPVR